MHAPPAGWHPEPAPGRASWLDSHRFRMALVAACTLVFLVTWLLPVDFGQHEPMWFPVGLHAAVEVFAIVVAMLVFGISWHAWQAERPSNVIIIACGSLAAGLVDFGHMMSYQGMPDLMTPASPQKSINFWLCARMLGALSVLVVAFRAWRPFASPSARYLWLAATLSIVALVYYMALWQPQAWPVFYVEGSGLTPLKVAIEALVVLVMAVAALRLLRARSENPPFDVDGLLAAALLWILSEMSLTVYENVNDFFSLAGHAFKLLAYLLVYRLVFVVSVRSPYARLASEMARSQSAEMQVEALAFYDGPTGLPNRALLRDRASQVLAAREEDDERAALVLLNVDGFKHVNDSLGHAVGDELLRSLGKRLAAIVAESDTVACLGGDEFAILLREVNNAGEVAALQERILEALSRPLEVAGQDLRITVSMGAAMSPGDGREFATLLQNAGTAQHRAREAGGNGWRFYDAAMNREVSERLAMRNGLRKALERREFELHYQPQVELADGRLVGVEALVRWRHPEQGMVAPLRFIPEAEESGLIVPIGKWILREACRQAAAWRAAGLDVPYVAVNLSAVQFQRGDVAQDVLEALSASGLPPQALELELTESVLLHDAEGVLATVRRLRELGVRLSIDDFGTGYSSLAYLQRFPVDKLKIDQSFVSRLGEGEDGRVIVSTIVQLARSLGLGTLAEGVEDEALARQLAGLGCRFGQGYCFGRPMPADGLAEWVAANPARLPAARTPA